MFVVVAAAKPPPADTHPLHHSRECYEKDGSLLPTKKGIFLKPDQWRAIVGAAADITTALDRQNTGYVLELGSK